MTTKDINAAYFGTQDEIRINFNNSLYGNLDSTTSSRIISIPCGKAPNKSNRAFYNIYLIKIVQYFLSSGNHNIHKIVNTKNLNDIYGNLHYCLLKSRRE